MRTIGIALVVILLVVMSGMARAQGDPNAPPVANWTVSPVLLVPINSITSAGPMEAGISLSGKGWSMKGEGVVPWLVNHVYGELPVIGTSWSAMQAGVGLSLNAIDVKTGSVQFKAGISYLTQIGKPAVIFGGSIPLG